MIYVTGDMHGSIDIRKLLENNITNQITENDYLIVCGDFGLIWNYKKEDKNERKWLKWLEERPWTTLFADGNHECFPRLYQFPVKEWHGGKVHEIRPKVLHLMRGEIFDIEDKKIFVMGGAASHDRGPAKGDTKSVIGKFWWPEEIASDEEMENGLRNLEKNDWKVDFIITHCLPTTFQEIVKKDKYKADKQTEYLEKIFEKASFTHWYSGHYHYDLDVTENISVIFTRIIRIGETIRESETMLGVPKYRRGDTVLIAYEGERLFGTVKEAMPFGTMLRHEAPYYKITLFDTSRSKTEVTIIETRVLEKSLFSY